MSEDCMITYCSCRRVWGRLVWLHLMYNLIIRELPDLPKRCQIPLVSTFFLLVSTFLFGHHTSYLFSLYCYFDWDIVMLSIVPLIHGLLFCIIACAQLINALSYSSNCVSFTLTHTLSEADYLARFQ